MNILNEVVKGASRQFGREFGRAGANAILKGKNYYTVRNYSDFSGRIKPSDSEIVRAVKEMNKIKPAATDKTNTSRLIELTEIINNNIVFSGVDSLNEISDISTMINTYNDKYELINTHISEKFNDKLVDFLKDKRNDFVYSLESFNKRCNSFVKSNLESAIKSKKSKKTATILSCPFLIVGCFGFHKFYLKQYGYGVLYIFLNLLYISGILSLVNFIQFLIMSEDKFNSKYNPEFSFFSQFNITDDEDVDEIEIIDINDRDELFYEAARLVVKEGRASASFLQRELKIGYNRAGRLIDQFESAGIVSSFEGSKARQVLVTGLVALDRHLENEKK